MAFVKHSVNIFLILLIVVSVGTIAALTLYYQGTFQRVVGEYSTTNDSLLSCQKSLATSKAELSTAQDAVSANQQDVDKTVSLFEQKKTELQKSQDALTAANNNIKQLQSTIVTKQGIIDQQAITLKARDATIVSLGDQVDNLKQDLEDLQDKYDSYKSAHP